MNHTIDTKRNVALLDDIGKRLSDIENELYATIGGELAKNNPGRDPGKCNVIFGHFTRDFLMPCNAHGLLSRAALAGDGIIEWVIAIEKEMGNQFHKGALFHDTAIAHFLCGNVDKYEYLLAMAAEEDV